MAQGSIPQHEASTKEAIEQGEEDRVAPTQRMSQVRFWLEGSLALFDIPTAAPRVV